MPDQLPDPRPPGPRDWKVEYSFDGGEVHVRPRNDLTFHSLDTECACGPDTMPRFPEDRCWLIVHHALDGRQAAKVRVKA